jgi:hypothetical protein
MNIITTTKRKRLIQAFRSFNPYKLIDGEVSYSWEDFRADWKRRGNNLSFIDWMIEEASESRYCQQHDC